jgi:hypothetical protein
MFMFDCHGLRTVSLGAGAVLLAASLFPFTLPALADDVPWATNVISYDPGLWVDEDYMDPLAALGEPTRFTGEPIFPGVVSVFNPPWSVGQIVSIGPGGHLIVSFDSPITNNPKHPFGIDLLIFGNAGFIDPNYPSGIVGSGMFGDDGGIVELSADGETWFIVPGVEADGMYPTIGYLDAGPYDQKPGNEHTNFTRPVDPSLTFSDFQGLNYAQVLELYNGSGGGAGVDIGSVGLDEVLYVRISNPEDADVTVEIDAFAKVTPVMTGDLNGDGVVNVADLLILFDHWGGCPPGPCPADLNGDGVVNVADLLILFDNWG